MKRFSTDNTSGQEVHSTCLDLGAAGLTEELAYRHGTADSGYDFRRPDIVPLSLSINQGTFTTASGEANAPLLTLSLQDRLLAFTCTCAEPGTGLCPTQSRLLYSLLRHKDWRLFFDASLRHKRLQHVATTYGMENEPALERFFRIAWEEGQVLITPEQGSLLPVTTDSLADLGRVLFPASAALPVQQEGRCIVIRHHKYYRHTLIELYDAATGKDGQIKNPLVPADVRELAWSTADAAAARFFAALSGLATATPSEPSAALLRSLSVVAANPLDLPVYCHNSDASEKVNARSLEPVQLRVLERNALRLSVDRKGAFYELSGQLRINDREYDLQDLDIAFSFFVRRQEQLFLVPDLQTLNLLLFFRKRKGIVHIHHSGYPAFKKQVLDKLELRIAIAHRHVPLLAGPSLEEQGFGQAPEKIIYLSDSGNHVTLLPVMKYGEVEIPVRSKRNIIAHDPQGTEFFVVRDHQAEISFTALIIRQHPAFEEQLDNDLTDFYLHKDRFLAEDWFLQVFEEWRAAGVRVFGFNSISGNKLNPHKAHISVHVDSGINWFNTRLELRFGNRKAGLKQLQKALRNKSRYVALDDGTLGILPSEWIDRLSAFFQSGDVFDAETLRTPRISYMAIAETYDEDMLSPAAREELRLLQEKMAGYRQIEQVEVPEGLTATLRPYQREGLNWLCFLDRFNFGGCLADDMGLGKTLQILAFVLLQRQKSTHNTNLLVVPTSLILNWVAEANRHAPSLKICVLHGAARSRSRKDFDQYELIITSYGTLLSDAGFLKEYMFNYIFLDESQNIKNPGSERYKAACSLKARNRIVLTGTPFENNTFDLYGQMSFACPGLLGNRQHFRDIYSIPIDKFHDSRRAAELQEKIRPFILRRTKQQVAQELPDKTETILYCDMQPEQRRVYEAYEREFRDFVSATTGDALPGKTVHILKGLTRLRQVCDAPRLLGEEQFAEIASCKTEALMEQIELRTPQHKILVFSQFVSMLELIREQLEQKGIRYAWLTGSTVNRNEAVEQFQSDPSVRVFLISLKAGGTGLNLTAADYVYLVDPWWNPAVENQAIDRAYRIGQHRNVVAVRLICSGTIEERMLQLQDSKRQLAGDLVSTAPLHNNLSREELLQLLRPFQQEEPS